MQGPEDNISRAAEASTLHAQVRHILREHAPCDTGYPGKKTCEICVGGHECADALETMLKERDASVDWRPAIRDVLGLW